MPNALPSLDRADRLIVEGNELEDTGDFNSALRCYHEAMGLAPHDPRAYMNLGNVLERLGRRVEAISAQREASVRAPDYAPAHFNLAMLLVASGDLAAAEVELRAALRLAPDMAEASVVLAEVLESTGRIAEAEAELKLALRTRPGFAGAALNLGILYLHNDRNGDAEQMLLQARSLDPSSGSIESALGTLYIKTGRLTEARRALRLALDKDPSLLDAHSPLLFSLNLNTEFDVSTIFAEHERFGEHVAQTSRPRFTSWTNRPARERKLKIGYVSGDFRQHPIGLFLRPVVERHHRARYEVHCYSNHQEVDEVTRWLQGSVDQWHAIAADADAAVAEQIRRDEIDILVDLSGHTAHNRLAVFAMHPSPIQVTWLGYLNTTGLTTMDYRICDRYTDPEGATEHLHTERLLRMAHSQWCYAPCYDVPLTALNPAGPEHAPVFGSFNQYMKISDACLDLWCRILAQLPAARLLVLGVPGGYAQEALRQRLVQRNVDLDRVEVRDRLAILEYFAAIASVDIALDTFPYNGATTTLDALWMGVPLVALRGDRGIARGSYSLLQTLQLPELVASGVDDYVARNVALARDPGWRSRLRATLRDRLVGSPLMNSAAFVADLEALYRQMWHTWCDSQAPSA